MEDADERIPIIPVKKTEDEAAFALARIVLSHSDGESITEEKLRESYLKGEHKDLFSHFDKNSDGQLDDEELRPVIEATKIIEGVQDLIKSFDSDGDGKLNFEETKALVKAYEEKRPDTELLSRWDKDKDGTLSVLELRRLFEDVNTEQTTLRYAGYSFALNTILFQTVRYTAYTSDLGESFRPIISPRFVTFSYAVSWGYVFGDVAWQGLKAHRASRNPSEVGAVVVERMVFQSLASIVAPFILIHSTVSLFKNICKRMNRFQRWGPTVMGLALIPFLPRIVDPPVEHGLAWIKSRYFQKYFPFDVPGHHH